MARICDKVFAVLAQTQEETKKRCWCVCVVRWCVCVLVCVCVVGWCLDMLNTTTKPDMLNTTSAGLLQSPLQFDRSGRSVKGWRSVALLNLRNNSIFFSYFLMTNPDLPTQDVDSGYYGTTRDFEGVYISYKI